MIYLELFWTFFKIGAFTFGGGYAMLPLIQAEVESHGWMASADLVNFVAVSESTPGPFAVNISTYVGTELAGIPGGIFATLGGMSFYISLAIFLLMTVLAFKKVHPILLICLSAVIGICAGYGLGLPV